MTTSFPVRIAVGVGALTLGVVTGTATVAVHRYWWGLLLALAATAALLVAVPGGWWRRLPLAVGWVGALLVLAQERPEGDLLMTGSTSGYALLAAGVLVLLGGVVGLRRRPPEDAAIVGERGSTS